MTDLYDKHGIPIREYDVLKVFHFVGARRKRYYMYKWVTRVGDHLYGSHLERKEGSYLLRQDSLGDTEIVQGFDGDGRTFEDRPRRPAQPKPDGPNR